MFSPYQQKSRYPPVVWDNHACLPLRPGDRSFLPQLADVAASGVDVISLNVGFGPEPLSLHLAMLDDFGSWIGEHDDQYALVRTTTAIAQAKASGRLAVLFDVEGMAPLDGGHLELVRVLRRKGVGWMLIAYNRANDAGGGCVEPDGGLTAYGRAIIREMREAGMMLCCSHTGHRTATEAMNMAEMPVIFSHSNPSGVHAHYRNIGDDLIRSCAGTGGVVGINGLSHFLGGEATPERVAEHVDYVAQLVGVDHVGLGLDFVFDRAELDTYLATMRETFPDGAEFRENLTILPPHRIGGVAVALKTLGYSPRDIAKVLGENWLRVARAVWDNAVS